MQKDKRYLNNNEEIIPEKILFRLMQESDIKQVAAIEAETFTTPWSEQGFLDSLQKEYTLYYVAVTSEGEVLGYCGLYQTADEADITNVAVKSSARKKNIAWNMLKKLMEKGQERGISHFTLEVRVGNEPAIKLYEKLGFVSEGIRKNFYREPIEDACIMWKHLQ